MSLSEKRLRRRIRGTFHLNDPTLPPDVAERAEQEVIQLIRTYGKAPSWDKERVYADGEKKLLQLLREGRRRKGRSAEHGDTNA